jgi:hypothetical protein
VFTLQAPIHAVNHSRTLTHTLETALPAYAYMCDTAQPKKCALVIKHTS